MNFALFTADGIQFLLRWLHIFFGVVWIGLLYYFNFVQGAFFAETDASTKSNAIQKLVPRALWWFRWGAMFTLITGLAILGILGSQLGSTFFESSRGTLITMGACMAIVMWFNVWFVIWPNQKIVIQSATQAATGGAALPQAAACGAKAGLASRHNVLFSIPMLFFMAAASHLPVAVNPASSHAVMWILFFVILLGLEFNALKGKLGPITSVKGVIHCGFLLAAVLYAMVEILVK